MPIARNMARAGARAYPSVTSRDSLSMSTELTGTPPARGTNNQPSGQCAVDVYTPPVQQEAHEGLPEAVLACRQGGRLHPISSDPSGQRAGVERQRADCEAHGLARGWEVVEVFCDNDASAYGRKPRRAYERMSAAVASGSIDAIVTWHNDRLHR